MTKPSGNALVIAFALIVVAVVTGVVVIAVSEPENGETIITLLLGSLAPTIGVLANLYKTGDIAKRTEDLTNGLMDAKIRAGVADVVVPHLVADDAKPMIEADRARRGNLS